MQKKTKTNTKPAGKNKESTGGGSGSGSGDDAATGSAPATAAAAATAPVKSSSSCWKILAAIPILVAALLGGLGGTITGSLAEGNEAGATTTTTTTTTTTPGLDFGTGSMFDKIADRYDTINRVLAMNMDIGWRKTMTSRIREELLLLSDADEDGDRDGDRNGIAAPWRVLDVATGTADVALQLVSDLSPTRPTQILGLDPSENMLAVGREKIGAKSPGFFGSGGEGGDGDGDGGSSGIVLETADARDLSAYYERTRDPAHKFDAATIAFGIRNVVPNRERALCEIHKLLKPNGILAILEFSDPTYERDGILGAAAGWFIRHVVPVVGGLLSGGARKEYKHLQNSIREFPKPEEFAGQLEGLECPLREENFPGEEDRYFYAGNFIGSDIIGMNFGSVHLYISRVGVRPKSKLHRGRSQQ